MQAAWHTRPPRGALAVVLVGLLATVFAALLSTTEPVGGVEVSWEEKAPLPDSKPAQIPGGGGMQLSEAGIRAAETNSSGYQLYRVAAVLRVDAGSAVGQGRVTCSIRAPQGTTVAQTPGSRAAYPRSSSEEDLVKQGVPEQVQVEFNSHGSDISDLMLGDAFDSYTETRGVVVSWPRYKPNVQEWQWGLPPGKPKKPIELGFAAIWRTASQPSAHISCRVENDAGASTVHTAGKLGRAVS